MKDHRSVNTMQVTNPKDRSEVGLQFEEIFNDHHDPAKRAERKILNNRKNRAEQIKRDVGM